MITRRRLQATASAPHRPCSGPRFTGLRLGAGRGHNWAGDTAASIVRGVYMRPCISEFSYGFAITSEFVQAQGGVRGVPIFPSLREEGQRGGGWDVRLDRPGTPLFLQFKLCDRMARRTCREAEQAGFNVPCYRMHLRSARSSRQHEMLLELEEEGHAVYYSAPMFHQPEELNEAFLQRLVRARSVWIRPTEIGQLPDDGDHHVSFEQGGPWMLFSEPRRIEPKREFSDVDAQLLNQLHERGRTDLSEERLEALADAITNLIDKRQDISQRRRDVSMDAARPASPLQRIAYDASVYLESQLFVVQENEDPTDNRALGQDVS